MLEKCCITINAQPDGIARCSCSALLGHCYCKQPVASTSPSSLAGTVKGNGEINTPTMLGHTKIHRNRSFQYLNHLLQFPGAFLTIRDVNSSVHDRVQAPFVLHLCLNSLSKGCDGLCEVTSRPRDVMSCEFFVAVLFCHDARTLVSARSENNNILRLLHEYIYSYNLVEPNCVKSFYFRSTYVG